MGILGGNTSSINISYDGNTTSSIISNNIISIEVLTTENTQLSSSNLNNIEVFLCEGNSANKEIILPINISLSNYVITIINKSNTFPLRVRSIKFGDIDYNSILDSNIYTSSFSRYDLTTQSNFILPPLRSVRLRYILDNNIISFYED